MGVSGQYRTPAALPTGKEPLVPITPPNIIRVIKSKRMGHVARMGRREMHRKLQSGNLTSTEHLSN
jgi:hypothetical protein